MRDYVDGRWTAAADAKPVLNAAAGTDGLDVTGSGSDAVNNHYEGYRFLNLDLEGPPGAADMVPPPNSSGLFVYSDVSDVFVCGNTINGFSAGVYLADSVTISGATSARITIQGNTITNNYGVGGFLGAANSLRLNYNKFDHNGGGTMFDHNIYLSGYYLDGRPCGPSNPACPSRTDEQVVGNQLTRSSPDRSTGLCVGTSLVVHGTHDHLDLERNYIYEVPGQGIGAAGCWGIGVVMGYGDTTSWNGTPVAQDEGFTNVTIKGNKIYNTGNVGVALGECKTCVIENNIVVMSQPGRGILVPALAAAPTLQNKSGIDAVTIRNNTVYVASSATGAGSVGITLGSDPLGSGSRHVVANNSVLSASGAALTCLSMSQPAWNYAFIDNSACFSSSGAVNWESSHPTLANWKASGFDAHAVAGSPLFTGPAGPTYDFTTQTASPLVAAGNSIEGAPTDIAGRARANPPDIGAYEQASPNSVPTVPASRSGVVVALAIALVFVASSAQRRRRVTC